MGITIDDNENNEDICVTKNDRDSSSTFYSEINYASDSISNSILDRWFEWTDNDDSEVDPEIYNSLQLYTYGQVIQTYDATRAIRSSLKFPNLNLLGG